MAALLSVCQIEKNLTMVITIFRAEKSQKSFKILFTFEVAAL